MANELIARFPNRPAAISVWRWSKDAGNDARSCRAAIFVAFDAAVEWGRMGMNGQEEGLAAVNTAEAIQSVSQELAA
jgi:hypothetical protein